MTHQISRRALAKGAAWAAPAVVASATVPAYAASKPAYELYLARYVYVEHNYTNCPSPYGQVRTMRINGKKPDPGYPAGFNIRGKQGTNTGVSTTANINYVRIQFAFPAGVVQNIAITEGTWSASSRTQATNNGKLMDIFNLEFTGAKAGTTEPAGSITPWAGSVYDTTITFNDSACVQPIDSYMWNMQFNYTTTNGFTRTLNTGWNTDAIPLVEKTN